MNKNGNPLISIIVPVYNVRMYLERCIHSILSQSYSRLQVILIDDGSTDGSGAICDSLSSSFDFVLTVHTDNHGLSAARNKGMEFVEGSYVAFIDSDDYIGPNHVANLLHAIQETDLMMSVTGATKVYEGDPMSVSPKNASLVSALSKEEAILTSIAENDIFGAHAWGKLFSEALYPLLQFPEGKRYEDQFVMYKVFAAAGSVAYEDAEDYYYLSDRMSSISNREKIRLLDSFEAFSEMHDYIADTIPEIVGPVEARRYASLAAAYSALVAYGEHSQRDAVYPQVAQLAHDALRSTYVALNIKAVYAMALLGQKPLDLSLTIFERLRARAYSGQIGSRAI